MDGEAGWWTTCGNIGLPPLARVMGVGRQQQQGYIVARVEQQLFHAGYALEWVHIDIMGPLVETQKGNEYIFGYSGSIHKVGGSLSIKKSIGGNCGRGSSERICDTVWVSIGDSYRSREEF